MKLSIPTKSDPERTEYKKLRGVDFSVDESQVDMTRSPDMVNMISDEGGNPVKRKGWSKLAQATGEIKNLWSFYMENKRWFLVATDTYIQEFKLDTGFTETTKLIDSTSDDKLGFFYKSETAGGFYVFDKTKGYYFTITDDKLVINDIEPYVPLVLIARSPEGGGTVYEGINLLTRERKEQFLNTASNKTFLLSSTVDSTKGMTVQYKDSTGTYVDATYTVSDNTVTIDSSPQPVVEGEDNVSIQYFATGDDVSAKIYGCTNYAYYTESIIDRIFVTGNSDFNQNVWYSELGNPAYFPDLNYVSIGGSETKTMALVNLGEYLAILKEPNGYASTTYLLSKQRISTTITQDTDTVSTSTDKYTFTVSQATAGTGAIAKKCTGVLNDEPLYLSNNGVSGIISNNITADKVTRNRSAFIDPKLKAEPNLDKAIGIIYNNYFMVFINSHVYVLDGRQQSKDTKNNTNYLYESYYFENVPATAVCTYDDILMFGTADGHICKFNNTGTIDDYNDDNQPIYARWTTINDDDGYPEYLKTMNKRGSTITLAPSKKSSADISYSKDSNIEVFIGTALVDTWSGFDTIEFDRFAFDTRTGPRDMVMGKKVKKYKRLKLIVENNVINESLGIFGIVKTYDIVKYAK